MPTAVVEPEQEACQCGHAHHHHLDDDDDANRVSPTNLAQQLWMPWRAIVMNPIVTLVVYTVINLLFISLWLLVSLFIWLLTLPGLFLVLFGSVFYGLRQVTTYVTYPGQLSLIVRDGEANFARLTKRRLTMALDATHELALALGDRDVGIAPSGGSGIHAKRMRFVERHQNFVFSMETLVMPLGQALEAVQKDGQLGPNGAKLLTALQDLVKFNSSELTKCFAELTATPAKEFELRRQQLFLTPTPRVGPSSTVVPSSSLGPTASTATWMSGRLVTCLVEKENRIRDLLPLIGPPSSGPSVKRDFSWIARELFQRKPSEIDIITTLDLIRADLSVRFHGEQVWIPGHSSHQIDAMFIPAAGGFSVDKPAIILCNPNGGLYEFHHFQMDWVKFYTDLQCHVLLFNYRGYGRNAGTPSPWAHNLDALALVDFLKTRKGIKKIGVHGESIGGLVATFLARSSDSISVLIADRTFANLPALAQRLVASWAGRAVRWLTWWETDNTGNYLSARCPKLLCSDPNDEIILDGASLKSGVAARVELGDERLDIPTPLVLEDDGFGAFSGEQESPPSVLDSVPGLSKCVSLVGGEKRLRRHSEAETRPQLGSPLTEAMVRRFSKASLSLGRRAMHYADKRDSGIARGHVEIAVSEATAPPLSFPEELLAVVWMQLASLDGYCGQCFLQAAESGGFDPIRAWTASMLAWGAQVPASNRTTLTLEPFERQGLQIKPITIHQVHKTLTTIAEQHPGVKFDLDIGAVIHMVDYIMDALQRRWKLLDDAATAKQKNGSGTAKTDLIDGRGSTALMLGRLLVLHCGHNRQFSDSEKVQLVEFLRGVDFLPSATS